MTEIKPGSWWVPRYETRIVKNVKVLRVFAERVRYTITSTWDLSVNSEDSAKAFMENYRPLSSLEQFLLGCDELT